jgi:hypothetical protein
MFNFVCDYKVSHLSSNDLLRKDFHLTLGKYGIFVNLKNSGRIKCRKNMHVKVVSNYKLLIE